MRVALLLLLTALAVLAVLVWESLPLSVERDPGLLDAEERERLRALLRSAEVDPSRVRLVEVDRQPCGQVRVSRLATWLRLDRATRGGCVGVRQGRVESLHLTGARLRDLTPLATLAFLRHVVLRDGEVEQIGTLPEGCGWISLDLTRNRLTSLDGLEQCRQLTVLDVPHNRLRTLPVVGLAELTDLDASGNPLENVSPLAGLDRLSALSLRDTRLSDLRAIPPLPDLQRLDLSRTGMTRVDTDVVARWPRLQWLGVSATLVSEAKGPFEVDRARKDPTLRHAGYRISIRETPLGDRLARESTRAPEGATRRTVDALPQGSGRWQGARRSGQTRTGLQSQLDVSGSATWMSGARSIVFDVDRGLAVRVTASVESGRLRVYVRDGGGYAYAEAIPGKPLTIQGPLITGTDTYFFFAEAVEGKVHGLRWHVSG